MEALQPHVVPIFATPLGIAAVPDAAALNPGVATLLAERATPARADASRRQPFTFRSRDDLLDWTEEPVRKLTGGIMAAVLGVARPSTISATNSLQDYGYRPEPGTRSCARTAACFRRTIRTRPGAPFTA